tara:strand:- start:677 stop:946 length:270 start_codon:yes stop_codon:yes gene_type:complete
MNGNLEPEDRVMREPTLIEEISKTIATLGWSGDDDVVLEIGGTQVYEIDGHGTKWSPLKGTRKYNKDAFIVIKNRSRSPFEPSKAPENK